MKRLAARRSAPEAASSRAASACRAVRNASGMLSYRGCRISGCRDARWAPTPSTMPAVTASCRFAARADTGRRATTDRSAADPAAGRPRRRGRPSLPARATARRPARARRADCRPPAPSAGVVSGRRPGDLSGRRLRGRVRPHAGNYCLHPRWIPMRGAHCYLQFVHEARRAPRLNRCRDGSEIPPWWIHDGFVRRVAGPQYHIPGPDLLRCTIAVSRAN